jgi:hypothetical protein
MYGIGHVAIRHDRRSSHGTRERDTFSVGAIPRVCHSYRHVALVEEEGMILCGTHGG